MFLFNSNNLFENNYMFLVSKSITDRMLDFALPAKHRVKLKEIETRDKYLDLVRGLKKYESDGNTNYNCYTWRNLQRLVKGQGDLEIRGQVETIQTTALLKSAKILRRVLET